MKTNIDDLKLFLRIVEAGSLRQVAIETMSEPSTISRRLQNLETRLNAKLIERSKVHSYPTETGKRYYTRLKSIIEDMDLLEEEISGDFNTASGVLRVTSPVDFGAKYIAPWLAELQNAHKDLKAELLLSDQFVNLVEEGVDVAIRIGELPDSSMRAKPLGSMSMTLIASQSYIDSHGLPEHPKELSNHEFVLYNWLKTPTHITLKHGDEEHKVHMKSRFAINNVGAILKVVAKGAGIHYVPRWILGDNHDFVELLTDWDMGSFPLNALYKTSEVGYLPAKTRLFIDHIADRVNSIKL